MPSEVQDAWVKNAFGVDPASYGSSGAPPARIVARGDTPTPATETPVLPPLPPPPSSVDDDIPAPVNLPPPPPPPSATGDGLPAPVNLPPPPPPPSATGDGLPAPVNLPPPPPPPSAIGDGLPAPVNLPPPPPPPSSIGDSIPAPVTLPPPPPPPSSLGGGIPAPVTLPPPPQVGTTGTKVAAPNAKDAADAVALLKKHKAHTLVDVEIADLDKRLADAESLQDAGQTAAARLVNFQVIDRAAKLTVIADRAGHYTDALTAAETRVATTKSAVDALAPPIPTIAAALLAMQTETIAAAKTKADTRDFDVAGELLKPVEARCKAIDDLVAQAKQYDTSLAAVTLAAGKLTDPLVIAEARRIGTDRIEPAKAKAAAGDFKSALDLLAKADAECAAAGKITAGQDEAKSARAGAQTALDGGGGDLPKAIDAVQKLLDPLLKHPQAAAIKDLTDDIASAIAFAKQQPPPPTALAGLTAAADHCADARAAADRAGAFEPAMTAAKAALAALTEPVVETDKVAIHKNRIDAATALAAKKPPDYGAAMPLLDTAMTECAAAATIQTKDKAYQTALTAAQAALDALGAIKPTLDPAIGADAQKLQVSGINAAKALTVPPARDYDAAMKLLTSVPTDCDALKLKKKVGGTTPPTKAEFTKLMGEPGGQDKLDAMIGGLPDNADTKFVQAALQARFGLKSFANLSKTGSAGAGAADTKSLKKIYDLMTKVPATHVQNNPSFENLDVHGGSALDTENSDRGSFYSDDDKKVVLSCGRANDPNVGNTKIQSAVELPAVDADYQAVPDSTTAPAPTYFDWTTLHEVGHAIDDKKGFMNSKAGNSAFGGWQEHGRDVLPVAKAIAAANNVTGPEGEKYVAAYLQKASPTRPPAPTGRADWTAALDAADAWSDSIRVASNIWQNESLSNLRKAGDGRVYHEAYDNSWVSYEYAARSKGITGYQFRAPGEWLSELYAAYHSKKLKDSHPAAAWLATL